MSDIATLSFVADTSPLTAADVALDRLAARAATTEAALARMAANTAKAMANVPVAFGGGGGGGGGASGAGLSAHIAEQQRLSTTIGATTTAIGAQSAALHAAAAAHGAHGAAAYQNRLQLLELGHVGRALFDEMAAGGNIFRALAMEGGRLQVALSTGEGGLAGTMGRLATGALGLVSPFGIGIAAVGGLGLAAVLAATRMRSLREEQERALAGVGRATGLSASSLDALAVSGSQAAGLSIATGRGVADSLAATGRLDPANITGVMGLTRGYASAFGTNYADAGQQLGDIFSDPVRGADKLNERLGFLTDATRKYITALRDQGDAQGAARALLDASGTSMLEQARPGGVLDRFTTWWSNRNSTVEGWFSGPSAMQRYQHDALYGGRPGGTVDIALEAEDIRRAGQLRKMQQDNVLSSRLSLQAGDVVGRVNPDAQRFRDLQDEQKLLRSALANPDVVRGMAPGLDSNGRLVSGGSLLADTLGRVTDRLTNFMSSAERSTLAINAQVMGINAWTLGEKLAAATAQEMASRGIRQIQTADELIAVQSKQAEIIAQANDKAYNLNKDAGDQLALAGLFGLDRERASIRQKAGDYRDQLTDLSGGSDLEGIGASFLQSRTAVTSFSGALDDATKRLAGFPGYGGVGGAAAAATVTDDDHPLTIRGRGGAFSPGFASALNRTLGFEGGLNQRDTNGTPSNMGINAAANPGVDVSSLTPAGAALIYKKNYWDAIGADSMSPQMARVAFDTAVMQGVGRAMKEIGASGGDASRMMDLREGFESSLLAKNPAKYGPYRQAWADRDAGLRADIGSVSATRGVLGVRPTAAADINGWEQKSLAAANINTGEGIINSASNGLSQKIADFDLLTKSVGMTTAQLARYTEVTKLQNQLELAHVEISPKMRSEMGALGDQAATLAQRQADMQNRQQLMSTFGSDAADVMSAGVIGAFTPGQGFAKAARSSLFGLGQNLIRQGFGGIASGIFGGGKGGAGGGLLGSLMNNFEGWMPHFVGGTVNAPPGPALVGEHGPELVRMPAGAQVVPNGALGSMRTGAPIQLGDTHVHIHPVGGAQFTDVQIQQINGQAAQGVQQGNAQVIQYVTRNLPQIQSDAGQTA